MRFEAPAKLALQAAFDGGRLTSDGGLTWLAEVDKELGVCQAMAQHIPQWPSRRGPHTMLSLLKERVFQIACGYEDQNDSNFLRSDRLLKLVCGALPKSGEDLASQPTPSAGWRTRLPTPWLLADGEGSSRAVYRSARQGWCPIKEDCAGLRCH